MKSESQKSAVKKVMRLTNCSRSIAESYVRDQLAKIEKQLREGKTAAEFGKPVNGRFN